ncbi:hypothetical protein FB451DRAFT_1190218 [Mycena latifolia]|nr:hypothetical protein FB451DRAFT_1190218 [Mycena latifolia]
MAVSRAAFCVKAPKISTSIMKLRIGTQWSTVFGSFDFLRASSTSADLSRCLEHAVHLGAGHFISDVSPMSAKAVLAKVKKMKAPLLKDNPDLDLNELNELLQDDEAEEDENEADADEFAAGDAVDSQITASIGVLRQDLQNS